MNVSEKIKMLAGALYRSTDPELQSALAEAQGHLRLLNATPNEEPELRRAVLQIFLGGIGEGTQLTSPFSCDYGRHIRIGVFLDCNLITLGDDAQIGPGVHIYAAWHPLESNIRRSGLEAAKQVAIGNNVWLGGSCVICPGVTIGGNTVIGAGSVVVRRHSRKQVGCRQPLPSRLRVDIMPFRSDWASTPTKFRGHEGVIRHSHDISWGLNDCLPCPIS